MKGVLEQTVVWKGVSKLTASTWRQQTPALTSCSCSCWPRTLKPALFQTPHPPMQVSEMLTENELLKERLADAKQAFADASAAEGTAKASAAGLKSELDAARQALAAAEAAAEEVRHVLERQLAEVLAERDGLAAEVGRRRCLQALGVEHVGARLGGAGWFAAGARAWGRAQGCRKQCHPRPSSLPAPRPCCSLPVPAGRLAAPAAGGARG